MINTAISAGSGGHLPNASLSIFPLTHAWTPLQKCLIMLAVVTGIGALGALIYTYERYYRGLDESFFIGSWRGDYVPTTLYFGPAERSFEFRADHIYGGSETYGKWFAGGDFLYLRFQVDLGGDPHDLLTLWHIDWMTSNEVQISDAGGYVILRRTE